MGAGHTFELQPAALNSDVVFLQIQAGQVRNPSRRMNCKIRFKVFCLPIGLRGYAVTLRRSGDRFHSVPVCTSIPAASNACMSHPVRSGSKWRTIRSPRWRTVTFAPARDAMCENSAAM
jgi:hypothetical protein